ncbi:MAG: HEAT repeat domain-containing protein [Candidatus Sedimenticola sp. (ex Thyasira tokunagai)]
MPKQPDASLFITTGCSHCPAVFDSLSRLVKEGKVGRLEVTNLSSRPQGAETSIRSVPWCRIGPFELSGAQSYTDLARWTEAATAGTGMCDYYSHLLEAGELDKAVALIRTTPETLNTLVPLLATLDTPMAVRIGIGAVLEILAEEKLISGAVEALLELTRSETPQIRADACHYLGLSGDHRITTTLHTLLEDDDPEVREIAQESLETLKSGEDRPTP